MKKALSLLLTLLMVFTLSVPFVSYAEEGTARMKYITSTEAYDPYRSVITEVNFVNTLEGAPESGYVWDVSEEGDGLVKAWLTDVAEADGIVSSAKLTIAADGTIALPEDSSYLFKDFSAVTSINFGNGIDTSDVVLMEKMFGGCSALENIDLSAFETSEVVTFSGMFENCSSLVSLDLSALEINSAVSIKKMMRGCSALETVRIDNWYFGKQLTDMSSLFEGCKSLKDVYIYDVNLHGDSKPDQNNVYYGVKTAELKFHDNRNIGTDAVLWERFFDDAKGATLVFDVPENYQLVLSETNLNLLVGQTVNVTATVLPTPNNSEITWGSDNTSVVTVKNGAITAVGEGTAKITVTNKTLDEDGPKTTKAEITVEVDIPTSDDCFKITFDKPDSIEYFLVSRDNGNTYIPVYGGTFEHLKGTTLMIKAYGNALSYIFSVNGKEVESSEENLLILEVNNNKEVTVRAIDIPSGEETVSFFDKIINWFKDLFEKLFGWMK